MNNKLHNQATFYNQKFSDLIFPNESFSDKEFENCSFEKCDFNESTFKNCEFTNCHFLKCNLNVLKVSNSKFSDVKFTDCKMLGIDWTRAYWRSLSLSCPLQFESCLISSSSFYGLNLSKIIITECRAHDVDFREGSFDGANFSDTDFRASFFDNTNLMNADFSNACNYDMDINKNKLKGSKFSRLEATRLLDSLGIELVD